MPRVVETTQPSHSRDAPAPRTDYPGTTSAIHVRGLVKRYGSRTVVDDVNFDVGPGEVFALLGPNGAGKTTTVEILEGYRVAEGGVARVLGLDPRRDSARLKPRVGLMLQQGGLYPQITAREALRLFAAFYADPEDPDGLLERLGLAEVADTRFRRLSGGQKQRLALGLAAIGKPEVLFLDEPTAAMDPRARQDTWELVRSLNAKGVAVLLTTHSMEEAEQLADRVAIMDHGRVVALDTPRGLRGASVNEMRFATSRPVNLNLLAAHLGVAPATLSQADDGLVVARLAVTPALVSALTAWLAEQDVLLTELQAGSRSLEQVFLHLVGSVEDAA